MLHNHINIEGYFSFTILQIMAGEQNEKRYISAAKEEISSSVAPKLCFLPITIRKYDREFYENALQLSINTFFLGEMD